MCIKSAILSFPLTLYVCPKSTFLPSSPSPPPFPPLLPLCLLPLFLPFAFVFGSLFLSFFPSFACLLNIHLASGVLAHSGSPSIKPAKHGPESASSSPYLREQKTAAREDGVKGGWDHLFQLHVLSWYFVVVVLYNESLVLQLKLTKGQMAVVAALLIIESYWQPKSKHKELFGDWYLSNIFSGRLQSLLSNKVSWGDLSNHFSVYFYIKPSVVPVLCLSGWNWCLRPLRTWWLCFHILSNQNSSIFQHPTCLTDIGHGFHGCNVCEDMAKLSGRSSSCRQIHSVVWLWFMVCF